MYEPVPRSPGAAPHRASNFFACTVPSLPAFDFNIEKRNLVVSYLAGLMFSAAWWLLIDAHVISLTNFAGNGSSSGSNYIFSGAMLWWFYVPGIVSTVALVMINLVSSEVFSGDSFFMDESSSTKAKIWMFASFVLAFGGLLGSGWILFGMYVVPDRSGDALPSNKWPGVALLLQNILIFLSALVMRFWRNSS